MIIEFLWFKDVKKFMGHLIKGKYDLPEFNYFPHTSYDSP